MPVSPIKAKCTNCFHTFTAVPKRTFLSFQKLSCPTCTAEVIYPLTSGYRITYIIILAISLLVAVVYIKEGGWGTIGGAGLAMIYALIKDWSIKKKI